MAILPQLLFALLVLAGTGLFAYHMGKIRRNILLGRDAEPVRDKGRAWETMLRIAIGQAKMVRRRTFAGIFHVFIYVGFLAVNIEVVEIVADGLSGNHRMVGHALQQAGAAGAYNAVIALAEIFMLLVFVSSVVFLLRRNVAKVPRFEKPEMKGWPKLDANLILWTETGLVLALWIMNGADQLLQDMGAPHYPAVGTFPISLGAKALLSGLGQSSLILVERTAWWAHIIGIFAFLNYIPFSKHLHIFLAFPNTYFTPQRPLGEFPINESVKKEVQLMMNPEAEEPAEEEEDAEPARFGAKDVQDLSWKNLLDAYTCTECGRCTAVCPANLTGKLLSPRKVMMDTRDRLHDVGRNIEQNKGEFQDDGQSLHERISAEELWACTTCNACADACPVNINPVSIIMQMREYLVMEESAAPEAVNAMFMNTENNQAPWAMPAADRFNWAEGITLKSGNGHASLQTGSVPDDNDGGGGGGE